MKPLPPEPSYKFFTGQNKKLVHIPIKKVGVIDCAFGRKTVVIDVYGECRGCSEKVWFGRAKAGGSSWVPLKEVSEDTSLYALHRCDGEFVRNKELRRLLTGLDQ